MEKLENIGYAYVQSALTHSFESVLHDEITMFIKQTNKEWRAFNHPESAEYVQLPMGHTNDLEQSFNCQVPFFGTILKSWI